MNSATVELNEVVNRLKPFITTSDYKRILVLQIISSTGGCYAIDVLENIVQTDLMPGERKENQAEREIDSQQSSPASR